MAVEIWVWYDMMCAWCNWKVCFPGMGLQICSVLKFCFRCEMPAILLYSSQTDMNDCLLFLHPRSFFRCELFSFCVYSHFIISWRYYLLSVFAVLEINIMTFRFCRH
jgi:hypothetical protein